MRIRSILTASLLVAAAAVAGCSNSGARSPFSLAGEQLATLVRPAPDTPDARTLITPAMLAGPGSVLLVVQETGDNAFTVAPIAANRGTVQWRGAGGLGIAQRSGVLVGTRGFGYDLITADIGPLSRALVNGGGRDVVRVNRILVAGRMVALTYRCDVFPLGGETLSYYGRSFATTLVEERCVGEDGDAFTNRYWVSPAGDVRRSLERVSPEIGMLDIVRLTD